MKKSTRKLIFYIICILIIVLVALLIVMFKKPTEVNNSTEDNNGTNEQVTVDTSVDSLDFPSTNSEENDKQDTITENGNDLDSEYQSIDYYDLSLESTLIKEYLIKVRQLYDNKDTEALIRLLNEDEVKSENLDNSNILQYIEKKGFVSNLEFKHIYFCGTGDGFFVIRGINKETNEDFWFGIGARNNVQENKYIFTLYSYNYFSSFGTEVVLNTPKLKDINAMKEKLNNIKISENNFIST